LEIKGAGMDCGLKLRKSENLFISGKLFSAKYVIQISKIMKNLKIATFI
jgi:hypothetical protein